MKKIGLCALMMLLFVTGCGKIATLENGKDAVLTLDNDGISVDDLYEEMKNKYALSILIDMVDKKILNDKYKETSEEKEYISSKISQIEMYYEYYYKTQYKTFEALLQAQYGVNNKDELKPIFSLEYKRTQAIEAYAKGLVTTKEIEKYYKDETIGDIKASHILITAEYDDDATDEEKKKAEEKALQTAKDIIEKLNKKEKSFADLAKQYSKDGSASNGGNVGWFNRGDMEEEFEKAAIKLKVNEYTKTPVKTKYGYHIILKTEVREKASLDSIKDTIIETIAEKKLKDSETLSYEALVELRKDNGIKIEDSELKKQYENYVYNTTK